MEIDQEIKALVQLAEKGQMTKKNLEGGTCALSNIGTISGYFASPLNIPNQTCIVALGKSVKKPFWNKEKSIFEPVDILPLSFGCDHRVLDGGSVAQFSLTWKKYLENPSFLISVLK